MADQVGSIVSQDQVLPSLALAGSSTVLEYLVTTEDIATNPDYQVLFKSTGAFQIAFDVSGPWFPYSANEGALVRIVHENVSVFVKGVGTLAARTISLFDTADTAGSTPLTWLTGSGAPSDSSGNDGDLYIDLATGDVYQKEASTWGTALFTTFLPGILDLANGGTGADLSATGGASQVLRQSSAGAPVTVSQLSYSDVAGLGTAATRDAGVASGVATLDVSGYVPVAQLPAIAITDTFVVGSQAAMLALTAQTGDVAVRTDTQSTYILQGTDPTNLADWVALLSPADGVTSVGLSLPAELTVTVSPVTSTGTLTAVWASQSQNLMFASPNGSSGTPSFRALVANDLPSTMNATTFASVTNSSLTSGRIPYVSTAGLMADSALLLWDGTHVSVGGAAVSTWNGTSRDPELQTVGTGTATSSGIGLLHFSSTTGSAANLSFGRSNNDTPGNYTAVVATNVLGNIYAEGADGTDLARAARIQFLVDTGATVSANIVPGRVTIATAAASGTLTNAITIDSTQTTTTLALVASTITNSALTSGRVTYAGASGLLTDDSAFTRGTLTFGIDPSTDNTLTTGYGKLGKVVGGTSGEFYVAHSSNYTNTGYAIWQNAAGDTAVNAKTGRTVYLASNDTAIVLVTGALVSVASAAGFRVLSSAASSSTSTGAAVITGGLGVGGNLTGTTATFTNITDSGLTSGRVTYAGTAGLLSDDSAFTRGSLTLGVDPNTDNTFTTGYGKMGLATSGTSTTFYIAQASNYNNTDYALKQGSGGSTAINSKSGGTTTICTNNVARLSINNTSATFASGVPVTMSDTTDSTTSTTGALIVSGGAGLAKALNVGTTITASGGTVSSSTPVLNLAQTWADGGGGATVFTGIKLNITNTSSSTSSLLFDLQVGGASFFNIARNGTTTLAGNFNMTANTISVGGITQANTNTATSGTTSVATFTESVNPAGSSTAVLSALAPICQTASACAQNITDATGGIRGIYAKATHAGTGTVTAAVAMMAQILTTNSSGTITSGIGLRCIDASKSGGTTITTLYGLYVDSLTAGATNYAIFTNTGLVKFSDSTASTTTTNGALVVSGGVGVAGAINAGSMTLGSALPIASGGTASTTAATARSALGVAIDQYGMMIEAPTAKTYYLVYSSKVAFTINELTILTISGTCTVAIQINGTNVTGLSAVSVTSTPSTTSATAANTVAATDIVTVVVTSPSSAVDLILNLKVTI